VAGDDPAWYGWAAASPCVPVSRHRHGKRRAARTTGRAARRAAVQTKSRSCTGKRAFRTAQKALRDIDHKVRMGEVRESLNYYTCRHCGLIHTGHRPKYRRDAR
jgi:hypothetical protein